MTPEEVAVALAAEHGARAQGEAARLSMAAQAIRDEDGARVFAEAARLLKEGGGRANRDGGPETSLAEIPRGD